MRHLKLAILVILGFGWFVTGIPSLAAPGDEERELIVLLGAERGTPTPEDVVEHVNHAQPLPDNLGAGNPSAGRFVIPKPDRRALRPDEEPDEPAARLQRYVVLSYPSVVNLEAIKRALRKNPHVLWVGENGHLHLSVAPNDPLFGIGSPPRPPDQYQWGSYSLKLPAAWDFNKGWAYVGVIDLGIDTTHPDLRAFHQNGGTTVYDGGNFRAHLAYDYAYPAESPNSVDEGQPEVEGGQLRTVGLAGHGTHVAGIIGATPNNAAGVAGACWNCSLIISKVGKLVKYLSIWANADATQATTAAAINGSVQKGAQVLNLSLGWNEAAGDPPPNCQTDPLHVLCTALQLVQDRDVVLAAAAGNDFRSVADFPARDSRALSVGGINSGGAFWNDCGTGECGSNYQADQIDAPAKQILSTFYRGIPYVVSCPGSTDFGLCTGTSMASPYVAGSAGVLRSVNPLLSKANIKTLLTTNLDNPAGWNPQFGYGKPNVAATVGAALGKAGGTGLANRLTPLFSLYSSTAQDSFYTAVPQMAARAIVDSGLSYQSVGPLVSGYLSFPGVPPCTFSPCVPKQPSASVYVFTGDRRPYAGTPALVPLYRMTYQSSGVHRDTTYTTETNGLLLFKGLGYELDGLEGYIYSRCTPEPSCIPPGAVRLYRLYSASRDDYAIFPESEIQIMQANGYTSNAALNDWIGYVYPNADADNDGLIDGFESLAGTAPNVADSDCDGTNDGGELLGFGATGYRDPLLGTCTPPPIFSDVPVGAFAKDFIDSMFLQRINGGCAGNPRRYCPDTPITRAETAVFLIAAKGPVDFILPSANCSPLRFQDVPCMAPSAPYIEEFARRGITIGCGGGNYCPDAKVDRGTMAYFVLATLGITPPTSCSGIFSDVPCTAWYAPWVEELYRRGITGGCGAGRFCPDLLTARSQMAVFVNRAFNLPLPLATPAVAKDTANGSTSR